MVIGIRVGDRPCVRTNVFVGPSYDCFGLLGTRYHNAVDVAGIVTVGVELHARRHEVVRARDSDRPLCDVLERRRDKQDGAALALALPNLTDGLLAIAPKQHLIMKVHHDAMDLLGRTFTAERSEERR